MVWGTVAPEDTKPLAEGTSDLAIEPRSLRFLSPEDERLYRLAALQQLGHGRVVALLVVVVGLVFATGDDSFHATAPAVGAARGDSGLPLRPCLAL
jgi:hypothetical protein